MKCAGQKQLAAKAKCVEALYLWRMVYGFGRDKICPTTHINGWSEDDAVRVMMTL